MGEITDINGVILTPLKIIEHPKGNIFHGMKNVDPGYVDFGEAYFSTITKGEIKAWKKHFRMTLNLIVPVGKVKFVLFDDREHSPSENTFGEIILSTENYYRLTIPPNVWMGFQGIGDNLNLILNIADIPHDPDEQKNVDPSLLEITYKW